jgi:hypothetical protein
MENFYAHNLVYTAGSTFRMDNVYIAHNLALLTTRSVIITKHIAGYFGCLVASNSSTQAIPFFCPSPWNANVPAVCDKLQIKWRYAYHVHASSVIYLGLGASWPCFALPKRYVAIKSAKSPLKLWHVFKWSVTRLRQPPPLKRSPLKSWTTSNEGIWTTWPLGALEIAVHSKGR